MAIFGRKKKAAKQAALSEENNEKSGRQSQDSSNVSQQGHKGNPFATPGYSEPPSRDPQESSEGTGYFPPVQTRSYVPRRRKFVSARLREGEFEEKSWVLGKDDPNYKRRRWEKAMFWICISVGVVLGAAICAYEYMTVSTGTFCPIWEEAFTEIDPASWNYEIQRGGSGTGSFEWLTDDPLNAYTDSAGLHIVPTITIDSTNITLDEIFDGYVLNMTINNTCVYNDTTWCSNTCTSDDYTMCGIRSNKTTGDIINPVRSARLTTKGKHSITYGRVEVVAKMPQGDWLWPAIWMMPENNTYGPWPQSGEIDIAESRGNSPDNYTNGRNSIISALHWGPSPLSDAFWRTDGSHAIKRTDYASGFHTYGVEWTADYIFTYIDSKLLQVMFLKFNSPNENMWTRGDFGTMIANNSALFDPWSQTGADNTPFDQSFYLILNVAVGGTNGFWPDGVSNKPWGDASLTAPAEFYNSRALWEPTWGVGDAKGMTVKSVKMWKEGAC